MADEIVRINSDAEDIDAAIAAIGGKQDALTAAQLAAVNSGIDSDGVAELIDLVDGGAKNVFEFSEIGKNADHSTTSYTSNGVVYTLNADYSVTVERTATSTVDSSCNFRVSTGSAVIDDYCNGNYVLSGCPSGGGDDTYEMTALSVAEGADYRYSDTGNGVLLPDKGTNTNIFARMLVRKTFTGTVTFKPMICSSAAWAISQAYAPHRPSYQELYERVATLEQASATRSAAKSLPGTTLEDEEEQEEWKK